MNKLRVTNRFFAILLVPAALALAAASPELDRARELYQHTDYDAALRVLSGLSEKTAEAQALAGQCYYMKADPKKASEIFQKLVSLNPNDSNYQMWLGRAWGRRAETSSFMTAPGYAAKAREAFEKSVGLNPRNSEAMSDLFEYYLDAPGFLGGGLDKAAALATRMAALDPAEGAWAQARLSEKRKQFPAAEQQLRRAAELAPRQVGRVIDLAKFLAKNGRFQESDATFQRAQAMAPDSPKLMFARASAYIANKRNLDTARELLKRYMASPLTPDDPPRAEAERLLRQAANS